MEAESVEDEGDGVLFCVYVYNVQPGVTIDYATGKSELAKSGSTGGSQSGYVRYRKNVRYIVYWKQFIRGIWRYRKKRCRNLWKRERNLYPQHEDHEIPPHGLRFCEEYQV